MLRADKIAVNGRIHRPMSGSGMGSVLLSRGGAGSGSSYSSAEDFSNTTGLRVPTSGNGLGKKLESLIVKPLVKKPKNIKFDM
jgi:hypothetical protein